LARDDPVVGIAAADHCVRAVALNGATLQPLAASEVPLSGTLTESTREALRALHLRPVAAAMALAPERATVRRMSLPRTSAGNVDRVVRFEAERYIPLPIEEVELAYQAETDSSADRLEVVVAAARREDALQVSRVLAEATTARGVVDTSATALLAAWRAATGDAAEPALIVDLSGAHASLAVCEGDKLLLARAVPTGTGALRAALAQDLRISIAEAESVRASRGVTGAEVGPPDLTAAPEAAGLDATSEWLTGLTQEVRRTLESFRSHRGGPVRCTVALTGEGADTPGLAEALEGGLSDPVTLFDPFEGSSLALPGPGRHFTLAYGLAVRAAGRSPVIVDLAPRSERLGRERRQQATGWLAAALFAVVVLLAGYTYAENRLSRAEGQLVATNTRVEGLRAQVGDLETAVDDAAAVSDVEGLLDGLSRIEARPLDILDAVSVSLPSGVWLTDFFYDQEKGISLRGNALDAAAVTEAVRALSRKQYFVSVKLSSIAIVTIGEKPVYEFEITADFEKPEESQAAPKESRTASPTAR
jgi:type IV pilus assembly protein PilM